MASVSTKNPTAVRVRSTAKPKPTTTAIAATTPEPAPAVAPDETAKQPDRVAGQDASTGAKAGDATGTPRRPAKRATKNAVPVIRTRAARPKGGLSALDAAAQVLSALPAKAAAEGLSAGDLIERMSAQRLWTSPGGKTPAATLYAAMVREITKRKGESRFRRLGPGRFAPASGSLRGAKTMNSVASAPAELTAKAPQKSAERPAPSSRGSRGGKTSGAAVSCSVTTPST